MTPLRVLLLEDDESDARLVLRELRLAGFEVVSRRVDNAADFASALTPELDLILADYHLPQFDALRALDLVRDRDIAVPVIVVSGAISEDAGVECIKAGASDYLLKDRLGRLGPAVANALESVRAEAELQQARRIHSVGLLAGGIAHDFNNFIGVIRGYAQFVAAEVAGDERVACYVAEIIDAADRAAALTRQLLAFGRSETVRPVSVDLSRVVWDAEALLRPALGEHIELITRCIPNVWPVRADDGQLEQVIVNLAMNARDAMADGGQLFIETSNVELTEPIGGPDGEPAGGARHVRLTVRDTGLGMEPAVAARAFDPFFTTKPGGEGTGLGLAMVYAIVTHAGGQVRLLSRPGAGTTVEIDLPATNETVAAPSRPPAADEAQGHGETILVVDDNRALNELACRILSNNGYRVLGATTPAEALVISGRHEGPIELLLTDVVMPRMQGTELAIQLVDDRAETRVLFMSGYTTDVDAVRRVRGADVGLVEKPFTTDALLRAVRDALAWRSGSATSADARVEVEAAARRTCASGVRIDAGTPNARRMSP